MKKALSLLLALVLCLSLCACGDSAEIKNEQNETSLSMTEELKKFAGTWVSLGPADSTIILNEDGTAKVNVEGYSDREWWWGEDPHCLGTPCLMAYNTFYSLDVKEYLGFTSFSWFDGSYVLRDELEDRLEEITLTPEVFLQYFQIDNLQLMGETDDFGNTTSAVGGAHIYSNSLNLFPNYKNGEIEVEITYTVTDYMVTLDWDSFAYTITEQVRPPRKEKTTITIDLGAKNEVDIATYYEDIMDQWLERQEFKKDEQNITVSFLSDISVTATKGTLFVVTEPQTE